MRDVEAADERTATIGRNRSRFLRVVVALTLMAFVETYLALQLLPHGLRVGEHRRVSVTVETTGMCRGNIGFRVDGQDWSNDHEPIPATWAGTVAGVFTRTGAGTGSFVNDLTGESVEMDTDEWHGNCFIN